ncbi:MAG TPA: O-antigen ligase family protein [Candidatus Acidoferrum sp.]|nr:O-antigen ligase family protein [Candidatus Acidoferrum sp.]
MNVSVQSPSRTQYRSSFSREKVFVRPYAGAEELSGLGQLALVFLWLLAFAIPWEDAITISGFGTSARLVGVVTVVLGLFAILEKGTIRRPAPGHLMMALFVISAAASHLWSLYPEGTWNQTLTYIQLFVMVWLIWELCPRAQEQLRLMQAYVLGTFVSGIDTVYDYLYHVESDYERYAGARLNANDLGLMMALSVPVSYYLLIHSKGPVAWVYRLQLILAGTTVLLTASRGATLASAVALAIVPLTQARLTGRQKVAIILTGLLLVSSIIAFVPSTSWERLSTTPNALEHSTLTGRTVIWKAGWEIFRQHPFIGIGSNAFRLVVSRVLREPIRLDDPDSPAPPAHNTFLSVLVEQGVIGFAIFSVLLVVMCLSLRTMPPLTQKLWIVVLAVWTVGVSSLTWEMRKPTWFFFGLLLAQSGTFLWKGYAPRLRPAAGLARHKTRALHLSLS